MAYSDLICQEDEYTYSANVQFDIENDKKLLRFIPNETTIKLLREYFTDMAREKSQNHARILYGSYGTGKSHFLTVLSQLLSKTFTNGVAYTGFLTRVRESDVQLAADIDSYTQDTSHKPLLIVPIVFDFEDFDRCIYFSLKKKLDGLGFKVSFKTFYDQAAALLTQWKANDESAKRLSEVCQYEKINLNRLEAQLCAFDPKSEEIFNKVFSGMTFGVTYVYEVSNMEETLNQANRAIENEYRGIVFLFDEFGRYIEDNIKSIKVKSIQNMAEYCDHGEGNNHILLVSHKEIGQYTQKYGKSVANEWKKVEGRYKADSINNKQDQCLSLIKNILSKNLPVWEKFKEQYRIQLDRMYAEAMDFKGFLINAGEESNPFEGGFPLHPISLFALDRLSKKVAQNERTFFTYLASKEDNSLYSFLASHDLSEFHFVGINAIYDYFEPSIKSVQSDASFEWYKNLQMALAKNNTSTYEDIPEVKILKVLATIGIINDSSILAANKSTILHTIDCPNDVISNALEELCAKKIIKYSGIYERYDFFDASIYDVQEMIVEESAQVKEEAVIKALNEHFINFVLYPNRYNRTYKISRVFIPVFATIEELKHRSFNNKFGAFVDGMLVMLLGNAETEEEALLRTSRQLDRSIIIMHTDCVSLSEAVKKYIAAQYLESQKAKYTDKDPAFEKELQYNLCEIIATIEAEIETWTESFNESNSVISKGKRYDEISTFDEISGLASDIMFNAYPNTLVVNNELINKNIISGSIANAKKIAIRAILKGEPEENYYGLNYLSPEYITVRSVLAKNAFINVNDCNAENMLPSGEPSKTAIQVEFDKALEKAKKSKVEFEELYTLLKQPPFGLRDGYLSLLIACKLKPYAKSLIISSHDAEQEISAELFEEIVRRPADFCFTVTSWSKEQLDYIESLEYLFESYIDRTALAKNRLKAIYGAMLSHYKGVSKFSRTTQRYVSNSTQNYRKLMEKTYTNYSNFFFQKLIGLAGDYTSTIEIIKNNKAELENAAVSLSIDLKASFCTTLDISNKFSLCNALKERYISVWAKKRQKAFDYYTNAFLEFVEKLPSDSTDFDIISSLSKALTGIELIYWNDQHKDEFVMRLEEINTALESYKMSSTLQGSETKMSLITATGEEKTMVFDRSGLSNLGQTMRNKINATFGNFGLSISYEDKVQVLLSLLDDLMEGKQ